jgi:anti-sigma factor ChrR (cupin superfamily)
VLAVNKPRGLVTLLIQADPGAIYPSHHHTANEECYILRGEVIIDGRVLHPGDFHHADADSDHAEIWTQTGAEVLLVGGIADYLPQ